MEKTPQRQRPRRAFRVIFVLSLALNLLFVGAFAGAAWRFGGLRGAAGPDVQSYAAPYMRALPREERRALYRSVRDSQPKLSKKSRRQLYQQMLEALRADPFDVARVEAVLDDQRTAAAGAITASQIGWLDRVANMSPKARLAYADTLETVIKRRPNRHPEKRPPKD